MLPSTCDCGWRRRWRISTLRCMRVWNRNLSGDAHSNEGCFDQCRIHGRCVDWNRNVGCNHRDRSRTRSCATSICRRIRTVCENTANLRSESGLYLSQRNRGAWFVLLPRRSSIIAKSHRCNRCWSQIQACRTRRASVAERGKRWGGTGSNDREARDW